MTVRSASSAALSSSDPFHLIGDDAHRQIFSFLLSLSPEVEMPKRNMSAFFIFSNARRQAFRANNPDVPFGMIATMISSEFKALTKDERDRWDRLAEDDKERYRNEMKGFVAYDERTKDEKETKSLAESCRALSRVSRTWRDVTGDVMNAHSPSDVISPRDLAMLKRRASSLNLAPIRGAFFRDMAEFYKNERWSDYDDERGVKPLGDIVRYYAEGSNDAFAELVAVEYRKFLVVKSVEVIASKLPVETWRGAPCKPTSKFVDLFWRAHMCLSTKYAADCLELVRQIIDGSAVYECNRSDYAEKEEALFPIERKYQSDASQVLFDSDFHFMDVAYTARRRLSNGHSSDESEADY